MTMLACPSALDTFANGADSHRLGWTVELTMDSFHYVFSIYTEGVGGSSPSPPTRIHPVRPLHEVSALALHPSKK